MAADFTPDDIRRAEFRAVRRGLDAAEVTRYLDQVADRVQGLIEENERLATRLGEYADRDLESEFDSLGREVAAVLQAAREAADSMRERATADAARWRSEATTEVETWRKEARSDAEALRGDAWATGSELLRQAAVEARRIRGEAERDVLTVMGEAEREAHRLTSTARREAEDLVRAAMMDAEKLASEAKKRHDEMIEQAHRQAESAQERTRALEQRREELMLELETVRSTLTRLEGTLEERREDLESPKESTSVRVVPSPKADPDEETWELGETVRIIPPAERRPTRPLSPARPPPEPVEVAPDRGPDLPGQPRIDTTRPADAEEREQVESEPEPIPEPEPEPIPEPEPGPPQQRPAGPATDDVGALFAALRGTTAATITVRSVPEPRREPERKPSPEPAVPVSTVPVAKADVIEQRDSRLLPITNRALRGVKKAVTDAQNVALDSLRTDGDWHPEGRALAEMMRADLIGLWAESYSAGHAAAEEMTGSKLKRRDTPSSDAADSFGDDLAGAVSNALINAGDGQREKQSATSRVFRGWRTDEAERRVRELALSGYHRGLVDSAGEADLEWIPSGTPCSACRAAASEPESNLPPIHHGCECSLAVTPP
ncbi:MAG TPA: DivIVA domain-containing protein [Acidimicrobiia bacterium]